MRKVALRVACGIDMVIGDCEKLVATADKDGKGAVDFEEFRAKMLTKNDSSPKMTN